MTTDEAVPADGHSLATDGSHEPAVAPKLLELLICPFTKTTLIYDSEKQELVSRAAGLAFPIRNGVPLMIEDAARKLDDDDLQRR